MDFILRPFIQSLQGKLYCSFNPCFNGFHPPTGDWTNESDVQFQFQSLF